MFLHYYFQYFHQTQDEKTYILGSSFAFITVPNDKLQIGFPPCADTTDDKCEAPTRNVEGMKAFCLEVSGNNTVLVFVPQTLLADGIYGAVVCTLQPDENLVEFFPKDNEREIYKWEVCPDGYTDNQQTETNFDDPDLDDFRIINPAHKTAKGSLPKKPKPGDPGYSIKKIPSAPTYEKFPFPGYFFNTEGGGGRNTSENSKNATKKVFIKTDVTDCKNVPEPGWDTSFVIIFLVLLFSEKNHTTNHKF